jgi:phosphoribosylaminoimidazole-succinocarboxamide synthase
LDRRFILREYPEKIIFKSSESGFSLCSFTDIYACPESGARLSVPGKSAINHRISSYFMEKLKILGMPNYFMRSINMREHMVHTLDPLPFCVRLWNRPNAFFCRRFGLSRDEVFEKPIIEYLYYGQDEKAHLIGEDHILAFEWLMGEELDEVENMALRANDLLQGLCAVFDLQIASLTLDFGRLAHSPIEDFVVCSEVIPDHMDLLDMRQELILDKSLWIQMEPLELLEVYQNIAQRLNIKLGNHLSPVLSMEDYKGPLRHKK